MLENVHEDTTQAFVYADLYSLVTFYLRTLCTTFLPPNTQLIDCQHIGYSASGNKHLNTMLNPTWTPLAKLTGREVLRECGTEHFTYGKADISH